MDASTVLEGLDYAHPRLMLKDADLERLKRRHAEDPVLQRLVEQSVALADRYLDAASLTHELIGPRLLHVSRECLRRTYALSLAWRWTGDDRYAAKGVENLLAVCDFPDWNPSHFLDTAEMSHAVGLGYDWLYHSMDEKTRERIRTGLLGLGIQEGLKAYSTPYWFVTCRHNWNQVCNGGLVVGALALADTDPEIAARIVSGAVESLPRALASYAPDGAWMEGPGYWHYATRYTAYALAALDSALGHDFGLSKAEGLDVTGRFPIYSRGPTDRPLGFADCGQVPPRGPMPCMFWLARRFDDALVAEDEHAVVAGRTAGPEHVIWYVPRPTGDVPSRDLDRLFRGLVPVVSFRSAWDDPDALFVGVKAGFNQVNHGHLDLGNFELDALGVRWACDLGADNYNMPGYWEMKEGGRRWSYWRLNSHSHNVPTVNDRDQRAEGTAELIRFEAGDDPFAVVDLSDAYGAPVTAAVRGVRMVDGRRAVLVQDEIELSEPAQVTWGMTTRADAAVQADGSAVLAADGRRLVVRVLTPEGARFTVESARREPPENPNEGVRRVECRLREVAGKVTISVLLAPDWPGPGTARTSAPGPIRGW